MKLVLLVYFKLTKQGEIVTQAEYDDRQTDVAIGRENQRKIDDVLTDVYVVYKIASILKQQSWSLIGLMTWPRNTGVMRGNTSINSETT